MKPAIALAVLALGLGILAPAAAASDAGFLYGRITTVDGDTYTGQLRWGTEETYWDDIFNSTKIDNDNIDYLDDDDIDDLRDHDHDGWNWGWFNHRDNDFTHVFAVRFGDLEAIRVEGGEDVVVVFRGGRELELEGGSNDIGAKITVLDAELGEMKIKWKRIETVEFMDTPEQLHPKLGEPLYGTVETEVGTFTGRVQWDHQECLTTDVLDGESEDGDMEIEFGKIVSIEKHRRGSMVTLASGRELYLKGTNDVNDDNRGVIIKGESGKVKVGWDDFERVTFSESPEGAGPAYATFAQTREITGTVTTDRGRSVTGRIVYDLDEAFDAEILHGKRRDTEFLIPFREIVSITPKGRKRAVVELRNGQTIELEDSQDVSRDNDGMLVFSDGDDPVYVAWRHVERIDLK